LNKNVLILRQFYGCNLSISVKQVIYTSPPVSTPKRSIQNQNDLNKQQ
jgi:hypothetical protein